MVFCTSPTRYVLGRPRSRKVERSVSVLARRELAVVSPRYELEWRRPKLMVYQSTISRPLKVHLNRYPGVVIGVGLQVGAWVFSLTWGRPGKVRPAGRHRTG